MKPAEAIAALIEVNTGLRDGPGSEVMEVRRDNGQISRTVKRHVPAAPDLYARRLSVVAGLRGVLGDLDESDRMAFYAALRRLPGQRPALR